MLFAEAKKYGAHQDIFLDTFRDFLDAVAPVIDRWPQYAWVAKQLLEAERVRRAAETESIVVYFLHIDHGPGLAWPCLGIFVRHICVVVLMGSAHSVGLFLFLCRGDLSPSLFWNMYFCPSPQARQKREETGVMQPQAVENRLEIIKINK